MTEAHLVIALLIFSISSALTIYFNHKLWPKLITITILFVIANMVYFSFDSFRGWPSDERPTGRLLTAEVKSPSKNDAGAIYLWVIPKLDHRFWVYRYRDDQAPRSFYIPYSSETNERVNTAKKMIEQGYIVEVDIIQKIGDNKSNSDGRSGSGEKGQSTGDGNATGNQGDSKNYNVPHFSIIDPRETLRKTPQ